VALEARGLAAQDAEGNWTMTESGFESLTYDGEEPLT